MTVLRELGAKMNVKLILKIRLRWKVMATTDLIRSSIEPLRRLSLVSADHRGVARVLFVRTDLIHPAEEVLRRSLGVVHLRGCHRCRARQHPEVLRQFHLPELRFVEIQGWQYRSTEG